MKNVSIALVIASLGLALTASAAPTATKTKTLPKKSVKAPAAASEATPVASTQTPAESQKSVAVVPTTPNPILNKLSVGLLISQADTLKGAQIVENSNGNKYDVDLNSSTAMGLTAQYTDVLPMANLSWMAGLTMDQTREISSAKGSGVVLNPSSKPSFRPFIAHGGVTYSFNNTFYAVGGLNYTVYSEKSSGKLKSFEMFPELGYQYGVGAKFEKASVELLQKQVNYTVSANYENFVKVEGKAALEGLVIQGRYNF